MSIWTKAGKFFGGAAAEGVSSTLGGIGDAAIKIREALTGDIPAAKRTELISLSGELDAKVNALKSSIVLAEIQGKSWLQRNWRPLLMSVIIVIVANNYILFPYASIFTDKVTILVLPDKLWNLMTIGVGGYIGGRSLEKIASKIV